MSKRTLHHFFTPSSEVKKKKTENNGTDTPTQNQPLMNKSNTIENNEADIGNGDEDMKVSPVKSVSKPKAKLPDTMIRNSTGDRSKEKKVKTSRSTPRPKRKRLSFSDEDDDVDEVVDSDGDFNPGNVSSESDGDVASLVDEDDVLTPDEGEIEGVLPKTVQDRRKPIKAKKVWVTPQKPKPTPTKSLNSSGLLSSFNYDPEPEVKESDKSNSMLYFHEKLDFLKTGSLMDAKQRRPDHENYDGSSLYVPQSFIKDQTPAMQQWWTIKSKNYNVVLFFKVGKFYELYHMDADVGVKVLGLTYMRGNYAHCGFPEVAYGRYSSLLVQEGFIAARVEQTEKPSELAERTKGKSGLSKADKTLRREICQMTSIGTQQMSSFDGVTLDDRNVYMLAMAEQDGQIGVCLVDTMSGDFRLAQFSDDRCCSRLATILAHYAPEQVLHERRQLSSQLQKILSNGLSAAFKVGLRPGKEFWDAGKTVKKLQQEAYFEQDGQSCWPEELKKLMTDDDVLCLTPRHDYQLVWSCLGAIVFYLKRHLIDHQVVRNGKFHWCDVNLFKSNQALTSSPNFKMPKNMIIDSVTLANLEILVNSNGNDDGTLASCLDNCITPFGKRLFRQWMCSPLCRPDDINDRLDAVEELLSKPFIQDQVSKVFRKLQDLDRMVLRIHSMSKGCVPDDHPDNRAVMFEEKQYRKNKVNIFVNLLEQFEKVYKMLRSMESDAQDFKSMKLRFLIGIEGLSGEGKFPDLGPIMSRWSKAFNYNKAKETGKISPIPGTNPEYDDAIESISRIEKRLEKYLDKQRQTLRCSDICYKGQNNKRYQIEIPNHVSRKLIPADFVHCAQRKGFCSFRTSDTGEFLKQITQAESNRDKAQGESISAIFREFKKDYPSWYRAVQCISELDCLLSLAQFARVSASDGPTCRPEVISPAGVESPLLELREARHPSLNKKSLFSGGDFIPNDTTLGGDLPRSLLLTGPNMGGKSTLMRQVGLHVILAQIGSFVPAESFKFTACDRVFTRLGASDRIMAGESTFYVELSETCSILKHATKNSLVLLDELGRGTATYDGTAIASAVLEAVSCPLKLGARTIFSTHYHTLIDDFSDNPNVALGHMACMVETDDVSETMTDEEKQEKITFLYKLSDGACPKSYGFHAAMLAGIPADIVKLAREKAENMEKSCRKMKLYRALRDCEDPLDYVHMFSSVKLE